MNAIIEASRVGKVIRIHQLLLQLMGAPHLEAIAELNTSAYPPSQACPTPFWAGK